MWGSSTNAQQFEGAWNEDGKGVSISDTRILKNGYSNFHIAVSYTHLAMAGTAVSQLPYTWTPNLCRLSQWVSSCWPILVYMFMSSKKLPHLKPLAAICFPPAIFCIVAVSYTHLKEFI